MSIEEMMWCGNMIHTVEIFDDEEILSSLCESNGLMSEEDFIEHSNNSEMQQCGIFAPSINPDKPFIDYPTYFSKYKQINRKIQLEKLPKGVE